MVHVSCFSRTAVDTGKSGLATEMARSRCKSRISMARLPAHRAGRRMGKKLYLIHAPAEFLRSMSFLPEAANQVALQTLRMGGTCPPGREMENGSITPRNTEAFRTCGRS